MIKTKIAEPTKAVVFARVSTQKQFDEGCSIETQVSIMKKYCKKHNLKIIKQFVIIDNHINHKKTVARMLSFY